MLPVFTIVGRPNVGKSTLFNYLTQSRDALVADMPGVTRDRQYGEGNINDRNFLVVDTGGLAEPDDTEIAAMTDKQVMQAINEADCILFVVDAKAGLATGDEEIATRLRTINKKIILLVNKADSEDAQLACSEFYALGIGEPHAISAMRGRGIKNIMLELLLAFPAAQPELEKAGTTKIAVIGRPNVGKSTLINCMLGEERVIVLDRPGTTRDSIYIPYERRGRQYTLIDTAGVRRRARVSEVIEKYSIIKTLQAIESAHVVILVVNAQEGLSDQDLKLLGKVLEMGKGLVIAFNKWDGMDEYDRAQFKREVDTRLTFADFARRYYISALHGTNVGDLYRAVDEAHEAMTQHLSTAHLTKILHSAINTHQPPLVKGRRIRLRYAHLGGRFPLTVVIHGKQTDVLPHAYKRFLANYYRKVLNLVGIPLLLRFKQDENPYQ